MNHRWIERIKSTSLMLLFPFFLSLTGVVVTSTLSLSLTPPTLAQTQSDLKAEADKLLQQGNQQFQISQYREAFHSWQKVLDIYREIGDREGEANSLMNLGSAYNSLGEYKKAIKFQQQSLAIFSDIGDRRGEAHSLNNLGLAYHNLGDYLKAIDYYQQSLVIKQTIGDRDGEGGTLSNLGILYELQEQPELAIVFYKQSVIVREGIRLGIRGLERQLQESYTATIAGTYRNLADLLLSQDRIWEAQQVLELLKLQEIQDFTRSRRARGELAKVFRVC